MQVSFRIKINRRVKEWLKLRKYFKKRNINGPPIDFLTFLMPSLDIVKITQRGVKDIDVNLIKEYGKIVGVFDHNRRPMVFTTDANLIKSVLIKDFNNFVNRRSDRFFYIRNKKNNFYHYICRHSYFLKKGNRGNKSTIGESVR